MGYAFPDFWVGAHGTPDVLDVEISGINEALPTEEVMDAWNVRKT